jgi:RHS repeat-associated protein
MRKSEQDFVPKLGQITLPGVGLQYYKARMYSPLLGRFLQPDPIGVSGGMNIYGYVGGDPVNNTDPLGLCSIPLGSIIDASGDINFYYKDVPCSYGLPGILSGDGPNAQIEGGGGNEGTPPTLATNPAPATPTPAPVPATEKVKQVVCKAVGAIQNYQNKATGTLQLGGAATGQLGPIAGTLGNGIAIDAKGNMAFYNFLGGGSGEGLSGVAGASIQVSNGRTINDLKGAFYNASASGGFIEAGSVDGFYGRTQDGYLVLGGGATGGGGGGASAFVGKTNTTLSSSINPLTSLRNAMSSLAGC